MKRFLRILGSFIIFGSVAIPAFAMDTTTVPHVGAINMKIPDKVSSNSAGRTANLMARADAELTRRISSLNLLITKIGALKRLSAAQKTTFTNGVQTEITNLTALKAKIDADTDPTTLKTDVQSIVQDYRIFALYMPQIRILVASDVIETAADKLTDLATKLQAMIQAAQGQGKDATSLQTMLSDMTTKIADAKTQATNATNAVVGLTPAGFPGNKTTLQSAEAMLKTAFQDLKAALQDARTIRQGLKQLGVTSTDTTSSDSAH